MAEPGIVEGSIVDTPSGGAPLNGQAFRQAALEKGRFATSVGQHVSGVFQEVADKIQQNRNARQIFDADLAMRKTFDQFNAQLVKMPDEGTWLPAWDQASTQLREETLDNVHLGPEVKRALSMKFDNWQEATRSATQIAALKKGVNESRKSAIADATHAANDNKLEYANKIIDAAVENHAFSTKEGDEIKKKFPEMAAIANADQTIIHYPIDARQIMEGASWFKNMLPEDQKAALTAADVAKVKRQKSNFETLQAQRLDQTTGKIPESDIREAIKNKQIDATVGENLIAAQKRDSTRQDEGQKRYVSALAHDPVAWQGEDPDQYAAKLMNEVANIKNPTIRQQAAEDVDKELTSIKKTASTTDGPVHRTQIEMMNRIANERLGLVPTGNKNPRVPPFLEGGVKRVETMSDSDFKAMFGHNAKRDVVIRGIEDREESERNRLAEAQQKYRDWSHTEKGQNATPKEANEERERLGFGQYHTPQDVKAALQAGKIDRSMAKDILANQFGIQ